MWAIINKKLPTLPEEELKKFASPYLRLRTNENAHEHKFAIALEAPIQKICASESGVSFCKEIYESLCIEDAEDECRPGHTIALDKKLGVSILQGLQSVCTNKKNSLACFAVYEATSNMGALLSGLEACEEDLLETVEKNQKMDAICIMGYQKLYGQFSLALVNRWELIQRRCEKRMTGSACAAFFRGTDFFDSGLIHESVVF